VTTGFNSDGFQKTSEIADLTVKGDNKCNIWPDFLFSVFRATGGLIEDTVIVCGGYDDSYAYVDGCYSLTYEKATNITHMSVARGYAASIVLNDKTLWVTGGYNYGGSLASTEYVNMTGTMPGPDLPMALNEHAMVAINNTCSMVIGGDSGNTSASTFYYDHNEGEWATGPSLMQARRSHAAGIVTDEVTDENFVAVTGGEKFVAIREGSNYEDLDSTEILQDGNWVQGNINNANTYMLSFWKIYGLKILLQN
jgi:hypothetical protein